MKRIFRHGTLLVLAAAAIAAVCFSLGWLERFEYLLYDWRVITLARPSPVTDRIRIVAVDQTSLDWAEEHFDIRWKWPRQIYAPILSFCKRAGATAVVFDVLYTEASDAADPLDDALFGRAIADGAPFVTALPLSREQGAATNWPPELADRARYGRAPPGTAGALPRASFPIPAVATNAAVLGNVVATPDRDAIFRRIPAYQVFDGRVVPALGLAALCAAEDAPLDPTARTIGTQRLRMRPDGRITLHFRGRSQTHKWYNAAAIIESELRLAEGGTPQIDPAELRGCFVFFGLTAPGLKDLKPAPVGAGYPGVELQATLLDTVLAGDALRDPPWAVNLLAILASGLLAALVGRACRQAWQSALAFLVFTLLPLLPGIVAYRHNIWLPVAPLGLAGALASVGAIALNFALEGRQKRFIKGAFRQYLSPAVIDALVRNPDQLTLGGEERELSIFFSDVQGFTGISEGLTPTKLTALLNEYLTAMTDIILEEGGTIDKYEGDAIIAFWNAPLAQPDHPVRAVRAALRCRDALTAMRPDLAARYGKELHARIGLNTGRVVVGNMGSNQRFDYTFLGDAGNLASRLEGINKQFGTFILISEDLHKALRGAFPAREVATVRVVGRHAPVKVFEPLQPDAFAARSAPWDAFASALAAYYAGDVEAALAAFRALRITDPVADAYVRRIENMPSRPQPWDGVWTMTEK
jgi:adenylate cyclase